MIPNHVYKEALDALSSTDIKSLSEKLYWTTRCFWDKDEDPSIINAHPAVYLFVHRMMELTGQPPTLGDAQHWRFIDVRRRENPDRRVGRGGLPSWSGMNRRQCSKITCLK